MHFILATVILDFLRKRTSRDTGSGTIETLGHDLQYVITTRDRGAVGVNGPPIGNHPLQVLWSRDR